MAPMRAIVANACLAGGDELDALVGERLRVLRLQCGLSPALLASRIGVSAAEIARFEAGLMRIGATRLLRLADALGVHVSAFFDAGRPQPCLRAVSLS
jgi:transcriptional regulator with XRE-family HTH domain